MIRNIIFILLLTIPVGLFGQQGLYKITFRDIKNNQVTVNEFSGKKLVVAVINASQPDELFLRKLDTLYRINSGQLRVIAVPASNFGAPCSNDSLLAIYNRLQLGYIIAQTGKGKKADSDQQHILLQWLTHSTSNNKFDNDVEEPGQLFVVNENGVLYAVMKSKISPTGATMRKIISRKIQ